MRASAHSNVNFNDVIKKQKSFVLKKTKAKVKAKAVKGNPEFVVKNKQIGELTKQLYTVGFTATDLAKAYNVIAEMRKANASIWLGFSSSIGSSGLRDYITYLVKHKKIDCIITTASCIEEDIAKCLHDFFIADWFMDDVKLRQKALNRIGNIIVPSTAYVKLERFFVGFLDSLMKSSNVWSASELIKQLGKFMSKLKNHEQSFVYWAYKNNVPVFCPSLTDGSLGDMIYFYKMSKAARKKLHIDIANDIVKLNELAFATKKLGVIAIGGGIAKHHLINAALFRGGADYAVYITTGSMFDGSVSGALPTEAISWGKIKAKAKQRTAFVCADATIALPLLMPAFFE